MMRRMLIPVVLLIACALAWMLDARAFLVTYLAAWWFWIGIALGGLANVWLHNLTGGAWGDAIRAPLLRAGRTIPLACLFFLPVLAGMQFLYPWAGSAAIGMARWTGDFSAPEFKNAWLSLPFFIVRSLLYLVLWVGLAWMSEKPALQRSKAFSAGALMVYMFSVSLAAVDWIMSLLPQWYSSVFGWLVGTGQMLAGMALAIVLVVRAGENDRIKVLPDLANLLLMYVMTWAYLAFVQFLIIWAENLPHEISWYVRRSTTGWLVVAWALTILHFALPQLALLSRRLKRTPRWLGRLAAVLLVAHLIDCWWLIVPSLEALSLHWLWMAVLNVAALGVAAWVLFQRAARSSREVTHG